MGLLTSLSLISSLSTVGCSGKAPPGAGSGPATTTSTVTSGGATTGSASSFKPATASSALGEKDAALLAALEDAGVAMPSGPSDYNGPLFGVISPALVYAAPDGNRANRLGYVRHGARLAVDPKPIEGDHCPEGWYKLIPIGYICGKNGTVNPDDARVRLGTRAPNLEDVLPYPYAHNLAHGTPLYKSVPARDDMAEIEPYLNIEVSPERAAKRAAAEAKGKGDKGTEKAEADHQAERTAKHDKKGKKRRKKKKAEAVESESTKEATDTPATSATSTATAVATATATTTSTTTTRDATSDADAGAPLPGLPTAAPADTVAQIDLADAGVADAEAPKPWWQQKFEEGKAPDIKLSDLNADANEVLAKRMMRGFYVAVDRTFSMNGRLWHKTTAGLIAPADRVAVIKPPSFKGQEIDESHASNGLLFVLAKQASRYTYDAEKKSVTPSGTAARYERFFATGKIAEIGGKEYRETVDGFWLKVGDITYTDPGKPPSDLKTNERWIDVNLTRQTLVAFEGSRPVFATLVSTGRKGKDKKHDHTTPSGTWRVREKHVTATMDGDGVVSGDLPYSIEEVPYVMYFHESYATHGAFWHDNFGRQQSHGCVNLAPLDAKRIFFWADPQIPSGWYGMHSSADMPGSKVVVHE